ncbi:MAG: family 16 glycosylhydrolase, partial [Proteobacteria bacterium]|nr:family 16 glycosylhydrolase [Pseudomonadota bacterium]
MSQVAACKSPLVKKLVVFLFPVLLAACGGGNNDAAQGGELANPPTPTTGEWQLVWEDDFDGEALNPLNWEVQIGDGSSYGIPGWGNNERQYYTAENLSLADGLLTIEARSEDQGYDYTSGRIRTQGLVDFTYGRVEGRMKLPKGQGLWSAFWMLGSDATAYGTWAARGEIDI